MSLSFPVVQAPILLGARRCCCASREVLEGMALGLNLTSHRLQLPLRNSPSLHKDVQPRANQEPTFGTPVSVPRVFLGARRKERSFLQRAAALQPQRCSWLTSLFPSQIFSDHGLSKFVSFVPSSVWEARSRPGCQGPQRSCTEDSATTSWKMKLTGRRKNRVIRETTVRKEK